MVKLECDQCLLDIHNFYATSLRIVELNLKLIGLAMDSVQGVKMLGQGRVVVLRDDVSASQFKRLRYLQIYVAFPK